MTDVVYFAFSVGGITVALLIGAVWLRARPHSAHPRRFLLVAAAFYTIASTYGISYSAGRLLLIGLRPLQRSDVPPGRSVVVVLGSGGLTARDWDENRVAINDPPATARVLEAARVFRLVGADWVISSGGLQDPDDTDEPSGVTMAQALERLGVPASQIVVETKSRNTHEEAVIVAPMLESLGVDHVILVTSDTHMRRSLGTFRAQGIETIPAIARSPFSDLPWRSWLFPSSGGLAEASVVAHEVFGLAYYIARGRYRF